jgi:hypothetical protein
MININPEEKVITTDIEDAGGLGSTGLSVTGPEREDDEKARIDQGA